MKSRLFLAVVIVSLLGTSCVPPSQEAVLLQNNPPVIEQHADTAPLLQTNVGLAPAQSAPDQTINATVEVAPERSAPSQAINVNVETVPEKVTDPVVPPKPIAEPYAPNGTYENVDGVSVPSPYYAPSAPVGATAKCRDGTYSFSQHRSGTCSHHGGVEKWQ